MERSLKWVEQKDYRRFGCTECGWSHPNPSLRDDPATLDDTVLNFIKRAFAAHACDQYPAPRTTPAKPTDLTGKVIVVPAQPARFSVLRWAGAALSRRALHAECPPGQAQ